MADEGNWLDAAQQALWRDLRTVVMGLPALLDSQLQRDAGLLNFEYSVLALLSMSDEHTMRLSDLAAECTVAQPRLSKVMTRFEGRGWVTRHPDPTNGRYTLATLTQAGLQKVIDSAPGHVEQVRALVFAALSPTHQQQLGDCLAQVATVIKSHMHER